MNQKQSWWQLLAIQAGGTLCPPILFIGRLLAEQYGWKGALLTIALGNGVLLLLGLLFAGMSTRRPLSTVEHAIYYFGPNGRWIFGSLMMISVLIWFGIQLNAMSLSLASLGLDFNVLNLGIGIVITGLMCFGMRTVKNLSFVTIPLLVLVALNSERSEFPDFEMSMAGIFMVIGANIAAVIDLPTFFRHARNTGDARKCVILLYGGILPLVEMTGSTLSQGNWVFDVFVVLSGWLTNNSNLYSAIASSYSLLGGLSLPLRAAILGTIGMTIACFNPLGHLEGVLDGLVIAIGGMGLLIVGCYLLEKRSYS